MQIADIRKYLPSNMPNTTQIKMMGFPKFNALPKGWANRTYTLTVNELELFKKLNGVKGERRQLEVVERHKQASTKDHTIIVKCKDIGELYNLIDLLYNSNYEFEVS